MRDGVQQQRGRLGAGGDAPADRDRVGRDVERDDLAVARRGDIGPRDAVPGNREREFPARRAARGGIVASRAKIALGDHSAAGEIDQADRVIVIVGDERAAAVRTDRDPRRLRLHVRADPGAVPERDRLALLGEPAGTANEQVDIIVDPARNQYPAPAGQPGEPRIAVGHGQRLDTPGDAAADPVKEQILA